MSISLKVKALKQQLEQLFPGKWFSGEKSSQTILTGINTIDEFFPHGLKRQRITPWVGSVSCGKTSMLRLAATNWCSSNLNVVYIDPGNRLLASDWAFVGKQQNAGKFWVVRLGNWQLQQIIWTAEQLIRANSFDVVILDLGILRVVGQQQSRIISRLQKVLESSKTALLVVQDINHLSPANRYSPASHGNSASHSQNGFADNSSNSTILNSQNRIGFSWSSPVKRLKAISGVASFSPSVNCQLWKNGLVQKQKVALNTHVSNRLFTHSFVPDRRTSKKRS